MNQNITQAVTVAQIGAIYGCILSISVARILDHLIPHLARLYLNYHKDQTEAITRRLHWIVIILDTISTGMYISVTIRVILLIIELS